MTFSGCGIGRAADLAEVKVIEARLACVGRIVRNCRGKQSMDPSQLTVSWMSCRKACWREQW